MKATAENRPCKRMEKNKSSRVFNVKDENIKQSPKHNTSARLITDK